jgi:hypothetical protein
MCADALVLALPPLCLRIRRLRIPMIKNQIFKFR